MTDEEIESLVAQNHYTLCRFPVDGVMYYQWRRSDKTPLSPLFTSVRCAGEYRKKMPLITDAEWETIKLTPSKEPFPSIPITFGTDPAEGWVDIATEMKLP